MDPPKGKEPPAIAEVPFRAGEYWERRLSRLYNLQGVGDVGLPVTYNTCLYKVRGSAFRLARRLLKGRPSEWSVLDVGSGTGFYIREWLALKPGSLDGSDITSTAVSNLSENFPTAAFTQCDIGGELPKSLISRSFDVISAFDVLFHIIDDAAYSRAFRNFSRLLRKGGHLIFSDNLLDRTVAHGPHQVSRCEAEVRAVLADNGFTVERIIPMFVFMNDPVRSKSRFLRKLFDITYQLAARGESWGRVVGMIWYPIEILLIRVLRRGPSTEVFVCRKCD